MFITPRGELMMKNWPQDNFCFACSIIDWNMPQGVELKDYGRLRRDGELRIHSHETGTHRELGVLEGEQKTRVRIPPGYKVFQGVVAIDLI
jgi:hypothetical protein